MTDSIIERIEAADKLLKTFPQRALAGDSVIDETPRRVAEMWNELLSGYRQDPDAILSKTFTVPGAGGEENGSGIVVVKDIEFYSQCEHHLVPFFGKCHIAYIPSQKVVGLSKFARLVECFARRLQVQERMTAQIMDRINVNLCPLGVMVVVEAEHLCMTMRGIQKPGTKTMTSRVKGVFAESAKAREEAMRLMGL